MLRRVKGEKVSANEARPRSLRAAAMHASASALNTSALKAIGEHEESPPLASHIG